MSKNAKKYSESKCNVDQVKKIVKRLDNFFKFFRNVQNIILLSKSLEW